MFSIDDYWKIFKKLKGENVELDPNIESLIASEKELVSSFFSHTVDQISFNTESYQNLKKFLVDWYTAHRSIITIEKHVNDIYFIPENHLDELIRSFGFNFDLNILNRDTKINLLLDLCNLYKAKGTPQALFKILNYYGYTGIDVVEYWLKFDSNGNLVFQPDIVYPVPSTNRGSISPINYNEKIEDPHWFYQKTEILRKHQDNKISLPSLTPYFGLHYNIYLNKLNVGIAILNRYCHDYFVNYSATGVKPTRNIKISKTGKYVSILELYLGCVYTFVNVYSSLNFGMTYPLEYRKEQAVYAQTPSDFLVYTERDDTPTDYNIFFYTGDQTSASDIITETNPIFKRSFTRAQKKSKYTLFKNTLVYKQSLKFFDSLEEVALFLEDLNSDFKNDIDNVLLTTNSTDFLIALLKDLANWIKTNIGYEYSAIDELISSVLQDKEMKKIINFFKPYRARIIELKQFFPFDMEEVIPEDSCVEPAVNEIFVDWDTADGKPCCTEAELICGQDTTSVSYYTRETYDCGNCYDRGACDTSLTNAVTDYGIEIPKIKDEIPDILFCIGLDEECHFDGGYTLDSTGGVEFAYQSNGFSDYDCGDYYDCPTGYDLIYVFNTDKYHYLPAWAHEASFDWVYAAIDGVSLTAPVAGNFDGAVAAPYNDGGTWKVDITGPGAGNVKYLRGVYSTSAVFLWEGIWADSLTEDLVNYAVSFENQPTKTVVTLSSNPGSNVQLYYIYNTGETASKYEFMNVYPCPKRWKTETGSFTSDWAVDKLHELISCLKYEDIYLSKDQSNIRQWLWGEFKKYSFSLIPPLIYDNFQRANYDKGKLSVFLNSTSGTNSSIIENCAIIRETETSNCLKLAFSMPNSYDAAWYGYYLALEGITSYPWTTMDRLTLKFRGENLGNRLHIQINSASQTDIDRFENPDYIFHHSVPDRFVDWTQLDIDFNNFWRVENIYDDRDRVRANWYSYGDGQTFSVVDEENKIVVDNEIFYTTKKCSWTGTGTYLGFGVGNESDNSGKPTNQTNLNFLMNLSMDATTDLILQILQTGDSTPRQTTISAANIYWNTLHRYSVDFSSFSPAIDSSSEIIWIQFQLIGPPSEGSFEFGDIKFGDHQTFADLATKLLLFQFYSDRNNDNLENQVFYLDDIKIGPNISDPYPYAARLAISIREHGLHFWRGPTLLHYQHILAPYLVGDTTTTSVLIEMHNDAQDEYYTRYGGQKGPVMPVHTRNDLENIIVLGAENFNQWCWWLDYPEATYGYAQYWSLYKAAEYYAWTGDTRIQNYLDNFMTWMKAHVIEDSTYPNDPKGYTVPDTFNDSTVAYLKYDPYIMGSVGLAFLFYYWRTGDSQISTILRNILNDLRYNRWTANNYEHDNKHWVYGISKIFRLFGLVVNGRPPGVGIYDFPSIAADQTHFVELHDWFWSNSGDSKPNILNADGIPFVYLEDESSWDYAPNYIMQSGMGTMEAVVNLILSVLEYGRFSGDYSWYEVLKGFIIKREKLF